MALGASELNVVEERGRHLDSPSVVFKMDHWCSIPDNPSRRVEESLTVGDIVGIPGDCEEVVKVLELASFNQQS